MFKYILNMSTKSVASCSDSVVLYAFPYTIVPEIISLYQTVIEVKVTWKLILIMILIMVLVRSWLDVNYCKEVYKSLQTDSSSRFVTNRLNVVAYWMCTGKYYFDFIFIEALDTWARYNYCLHCGELDVKVPGSIP